MQTNPEQKAYGKWILGIIASGILIYLGVQNINVVAGAVVWGVNLFSPLLLGVAFALIVNVPMRFIESHLFAKTEKPFALKIRRPISIILAYLFIAVILACVFGLVIPALVNAIKILADGIANVVRDFFRYECGGFGKSPDCKIYTEYRLAKAVTIHPHLF